MTNTEHAQLILLRNFGNYCKSDSLFRNLILYVQDVFPILPSATSIFPHLLFRMEYLVELDGASKFLLCN